MCLAIPGLAGADLINTAQVSYRDPTGTVYTAPSNTVTVQVVAVEQPSLLPPDLADFNGKDVGLHDTLVIRNPEADAQFSWEFTLQDLNGSASASSLSVGSANVIKGTQAPSLSLSGLSISLGTYHVRVQSIKGGQKSEWAEATVNVVSAELSTARVHPNPFRSDRGHTQIIFDQLPMGSMVKIFTVSGHQVKTLEAPDGSAKWNLSTSNGDKAASGIYLYTITDSHNNQTRGKFAIIR